MSTGTRSKSKVKSVIAQQSDSTTASKRSSSSSSATHKRGTTNDEQTVIFSASASKSSLSRNKRRKTEPGPSHNVEVGETVAKTPNEPTESARNLPEEVVTMIARFLSARDRRNFRLVCKPWYDACRQYEKDEKFCIGNASDGDNLDEVFATLSKSRRQCFNFELYCLTFERSARIQFWKNCGPKIYSMKLVNCHLSGPPFASILRYCSGLQTLEFYFQDLRDLKEKVAIKLPSSIIPEDLKNESVRTLKIHVTCHDWYAQTGWLTVLRTLFDVFPSMTHFSMSEDDLHCGNNEGNQSRPIRVVHRLGNLSGSKGYHEFLNRCALQKYLARDQMKSIAMNFLMYPSIDWESLAYSKVTNVTEVAVDMDMFELLGADNFFTFIREQEHLSKVTGITKVDIGQSCINEFVSSVLQTPNVREFQLFLYAGDIEWTEHWSKLLIESKVKHLRLMSTSMTFPSTPVDSYPSNQNLTSFAVRVKDPRYNTNIVTLLKSFPNLRDLCLSHVNNEILESVCTHQVELRSLTAGNAMIGEISAFSGLNRLKKLEKLSVPGSLKLDEGTHFDHLIQLRIADIPYEGYSSIDLNNFKMYGSLSATLEVVWLDHFDIKPPKLDEKLQAKWFVNQVCNFVASQKSLRVLYFDYLDPISAKIKLTEANASAIFKSCPSLEIFVHEGQFVRDVISKRIHKCLGIDSEEVLQRYLNINKELEYQFRWIPLHSHSIIFG